MYNNIPTSVDSHLSSWSGLTGPSRNGSSRLTISFSHILHKMKMYHNYILPSPRLAAELARRVISPTNLLH
jgi:hypothetical protein